MHGKMVQKHPANDRASGKAWLGGLEWPGWAVVAAARAPGVPQPEQAGWGKFPPQTRHAVVGATRAAALARSRRAASRRAASSRRARSAAASLARAASRRAASSRAASADGLAEAGAPVCGVDTHRRIRDTATRASDSPSSYRMSYQEPP